MSLSEIHLTSKTPLITALSAWEAYLADQQRSKYTIRSFAGDIRLLSDYLSPDKPVGSLTLQDLKRFLEWVQSGRNRGIPCSPKSYARRVTSLKSFFRWLKLHGRIDSDPAEDLIQRTVISPIPEILTLNEQNHLINSAIAHASSGSSEDTRPLALFQLLIETGIKKMIAHEGPYLLEVTIEKEDNVFPMVPTGASVSDIILEP